MIQLKRTNLKELQGLLDQHPDRDIYASLPGTGVYLQVALIARVSLAPIASRHWQERAQLWSAVGNENRFAPDISVITSFVMLCTNGQNSPCVILSGQSVAGSAMAFVAGSCALRRGTSSQSTRLKEVSQGQFSSFFLWRISDWRHYFCSTLFSTYCPVYLTGQVKTRSVFSIYSILIVSNDKTKIQLMT